MASLYRVHGNISHDMIGSESGLDIRFASTLPTCDFYSNITEPTGNITMVEPMFLKVLPYVMAVCYALICLVGLVGNSLVIYVVLRFAKMKTVTNMYILNLAISDTLFLLMLPITITTTMLKHWVFGMAMCKIYFVFFSLNLFGGAFNLCFMSGDRYLAVCHPIRSLKYRTPRIALFSCLCIWSISFIVMLPIIMYSNTSANLKMPNKQSCNIDWPSNQLFASNKAFIWYSFILGFAVPVALISVFYILVVLRLRNVGPGKKSKEKRKSHRRVTRLVLTVIAVYIICWLPYWCFQMKIVFDGVVHMTKPHILIFSAFSVLSVANSMLNPFLYAFISDNFRKSFVKAFSCVSTREFRNKSTTMNENSVFPRTSHTYIKNGNSAAVIEERVELSVMDTSSASPPPQETQTTSAIAHKDDQGFLKPPVQL